METAEKLKNPKDKENPEYKVTERFLIELRDKARDTGRLEVLEIIEKIWVYCDEVSYEKKLKMTLDIICLKKKLVPFKHYERMESKAEFDRDVMNGINRYARKQNEQ